MKIREYNLTTEKNIDDKKIVSLADIHLSYSFSKGRAKRIVSLVEKIDPTHIFIVGDLYNPEYVKNPKEKGVSDFIHMLTDIADVYYIKGNMEQKNYLLPSTFYSDNNPFFHRVCEAYAIFNQDKNEDINHQTFRDGNMTISGFKPALELYYLDEKSRVYKMLELYRDFLKALAISIPDDTYNTLLCHDPLVIKLFSEIKELEKFDLVVAGHNHGGLFPHALKPIFNLAGLNTDLLYPEYIKGLYDEIAPLIVNEGVSKFHSNSGAFRVLEPFNVSKIDVINITRKRNLPLK